ncbi:hypothetical protein ABPG74_005023 [Tetrahymena malaccensis]
MIEKQLAGIIDDQEKSHIIVEPWIPKAVDKNQGFLKKIMSFKQTICKKRNKVKVDEDLNSTKSTNKSNSRLGSDVDDEDEHEHDDLKKRQKSQQANSEQNQEEEEDELKDDEAYIKKMDYIKEKNIMIIHSYRKAELYLMPTNINSRARKIQEIQLEEDCNVYRCFAFNTEQLLFGIGKKLICFQWSQHQQYFNELDVFNLKDEITQVCGNVEDSQDQNIRNGFIIRSSKNYLLLVRFMEGKVVIKGQAYIDDNKIIFEKERNFMFYHKQRVILIRWQANFASDYQKQNKNDKQKESGFSFNSKTMQLKSAVVITIYECNPSLTNNNFFAKTYSHRLDLKEFEVIKEIEEAYILPQMQNGKNRIAIVCQGKSFLLVFGYKDGSFILDKAAHNKIRLNFDISNNIIVGVKEDNKCEISTFNDSGSYESVLHQSASSFFHSAQSCVDVQEQFDLPFIGDYVVAIEQIRLQHGFEYYFLVQEPLYNEDEDDLEDESDQEEEEKQTEVRNREQKNEKKEQKLSQNQKQQKISENIIFSIYKMKIVTPKEKLRYLIQEGLDTEQTMKQFGFTNEIEFMISWEQSKKTYIDVQKYLIDSRSIELRSTSDLLGVRDYKYLKQELKSLVKDKKLKVSEIKNVLRHMMEVFAKNQFSCVYSTPEYHQKFENIEKRLAKIAQLLFAYQKMVVIYLDQDNVEIDLNEFNKIWKNMTLQELFLLVLQKKSDLNLQEFVAVFKREILNNYYTLFYEIRRELREMPMKTMFMKMDFLLPLEQQKLNEILSQESDSNFININESEIKLWNLWDKDSEETLFCKVYAKNCAAYTEQSEVENNVIPNFVSKRDQYSKKFIYSTVDGIEHLKTIKESLQQADTYMKLVKQFTTLYGEVDFSLLCLEAAMKDKGFVNSDVLKKEYINLSLYSVLLYENNLIDIDYNEFKEQKTLQKFCQIISNNPTNPAIILCHKTMKLFTEYSNKPDKFLKILRKFIHRQECTPHIFHEVFKCIQKEFDEVSRNNIFQNLFDFICEKLNFEHHDYLEEYVDILQDKSQKEKIQLYSNMSRLIYNFGINKNIGYLEQFVNFDENRKEEEEQKQDQDKTKEDTSKSKEGTSNQEIIKRAHSIIDEIIEKYFYNKVSDKNKQVALDRSLNIIDIRKITHMRTLLNFIQDNLFNKILKKGESEGKLLTKLLEFSKFDQFRDLQSSTSLSLEDVDRITLLNIRNTFKKHRIDEQIKRYIFEHFSLLKLENPTRTQEKAFFDLACLLLDPPIGLIYNLPDLRKKEKFTFLREVLEIFLQPQRINDLERVDFYSLHKYFTLFDKPDEEYVPFREQQFQLFLRDYALNLENVEKIVEVIEILKKEKSSYVSDLCYYLITEFEGLSTDQRKRFTQLGLLECQDEKLMMDIVSVIHQNKVISLPSKEKEVQGEKQTSKSIIQTQNSKDNTSLPEIKEENEEKSSTNNSQSNIKPQQNVEKSKQQQSSSSKWFFGNPLQYFKDKLQKKGSNIRILSSQVFQNDSKQSLQQNEKEVKELLHKLYDDLISLVSDKKYNLNHIKSQEDDEDESNSEQNQIQNRRRQMDLFCKLLTRDPPSQAFYLLALNKQYFDLALISDIIMKLLKNFFINLDTLFLVKQMIRICVFRLCETPNSSIFYNEVTKQQLKEGFIPYLNEKYQKNDANRKIFERYFESFILINQLSYFQKYITKETEHKFLFEKAFRNTIIGQMIQESGNLDIFEKEPDIFRMEDFNTKELLISSIVCELRNNHIEKAMELWRKITVLNKSEQQSQSKNQQQIDQGWIDCFRKIHERSKHLKALIELLDRIHGENKDLFDRIVERKAFQLLKSLNNVSCEVDMSKYVKFEQIFRYKEGSQNISSSLTSNHVIKLRDPAEENRKILSKGENSERVVQTLKQINKYEIRQDLEEYNVFVLAHVLGYFIEGADSLVYYLFTKKLLQIKDKKISEDERTDQLGNEQDERLFESEDEEFYNIKQGKDDTNGSSKYGGQQLHRREIVEIMIDRIASIEFIQSQIQKISKKTEQDPLKLRKYRLLIHLLSEREKKLIENSLTYTKYNSSSYQVEQNASRKQMSESLYLRMTRHIESSQDGDQVSDKTCIWKYFETLLNQESTNLLDCSECKYLVTEFIHQKFTDIISFYLNTSVEYKADFVDIVNSTLENSISDFSNQAPLRKQLIQLLERIQYNMENVCEIIFDVMVQLILAQNSNDSINLVLISTKDYIVLTQEQNSILMQLSAVLRMSLILQDSSITNQLKMALIQNTKNASYFIERSIREIISKINQSSTVVDIIKLKYLVTYLQNTSLLQDLTLSCAEHLQASVLIPLLVKKLLPFEDIDIIDNVFNQVLIQSYNSFGTQLQEKQVEQIINTLEENQNQLQQPLFYGFVLQYVGAASFKKKNEMFKQLFDTLIKIINKNQEHEEALSQSSLKNYKNEVEFNSYLDMQIECYRLCLHKSIDDLIVYNIIDLFKQNKIYDAAKLNYRYQNYSQESVVNYFKKLKEDIIPMENNSNLSQITLKLLNMTKNDIKNIS